MSPRLTAIVPTLGASPWLVPCLEALRAATVELEIVLVAQGVPLPAAAAALADRVIRLERNAGFAAANNRALAEARGELVATVNDDVVVAPGWAEALVAALDASPPAAAAQGVNLRLGDRRLADGCGLAWNRCWQAVQIAHGEPAPSPAEPVREIFGVSATAAIYRRSDLETIALDGPGPRAFDARLVSYYEDVDLACRLRAAGRRALLVPAARAEHAGSASAGRLRLAGVHLLYGNRYLVLARLLGRAFPPRLPRIWWRDVVDLANAARRAEAARTAGIVAGWGRAAIRLRRFLHRGAPALPLAELQGRIAPWRVPIP